MYGKQQLNTSRVPGQKHLNGDAEGEQKQREKIHNIKEEGFYRQTMKSLLH